MEKFSIESNDLKSGNRDARIIVTGEASDLVLLIQNAMDADPAIYALLKTVVQTYEIARPYRAHIKLNVEKN